jgi:hypothetical protein
MGLKFEFGEIEISALDHVAPAMEARAAPAALALHGLAGWRSFQFVDPKDEDEFREADFASMFLVHVLTNCTQSALVIGCLLAYDFASTTLGRSNDVWIVPNFFTVLALQVGVRCSFVGQPYLCGWFHFVLTLSEWVTLTYADVHFGFVILQSDAMFILLFFCCFMCQGILIFQSWAYYPSHMLLCVAVAPCVIAFHLNCSQPDPKKPMVLSKREFMAMSFLIIGFALTFISTQLYMRRQHHARYQHVAELLRCEKERLNYELAFARRRSEQATGRVPLASDDGGGSSCSSTTMKNLPLAVWMRQQSRAPSVLSRGPASSGKSSFMSEFEVALASLQEQTPLSPISRNVDALDLDHSILRAATPPPSASQRAREQALWDTLERSGIIPTDME